jgi:hypothetical protein
VFPWGSQDGIETADGVGKEQKKLLVEIGSFFVCFLFVVHDVSELQEAWGPLTLLVHSHY